MANDFGRIDARLIDRSATVQTDIPVKGAVVAKTSKGTEKPTYFSKGNADAIIKQLGYPSVTFPDVQEILDYNREAGIWVSAPTLNGLFGGWHVETSGTVPFYAGEETPTALDSANVAYTESIGTGDNAIVSFTKVLDETYVINSLTSVTVGDTVIDLTVTDVPVEAISGAGIAAGSTFTRSTNTIVLVFDTAPILGADIEILCNADLSAKVYFSVYTKSPNAQTESILVSYSTDTTFFTLKHYITDNRGKSNLNSTYEFSLTPDTFNGFGEPIYIDNIFENDLYLEAIKYSLDVTAFVNDTSAVVVNGGSRGDTLTATEYTAGWAYFQKARTYPANIFMDFSADGAIPAIFDTLRTTYQKYQTYILPLPRTEDVSTATSTKSGYNINERGLQFYWNWRRVKESYNKTSFWVTNIGAVGTKFVQMRDIFNGGAPAMYDENNHGGQLSGVDVQEVMFDPSNEEINDLASAGINSIVFDPDAGLMITDHRTAQTPTNLSDTSYIAHSRLFDYIISNVINQVLVRQLTKLNDDTHRRILEGLGNQIITPILADGLLRDAVVKCDAENNTDEVLARRELVFAISVKVTPYSETIDFPFIINSQTGDVRAVFEE